MTIQVLGKVKKAFEAVRQDRRISPDTKFASPLLGERIKVRGSSR
jgi:hypothetical protein